MPVKVQGPDGKTYQFPDGTDKAAAVSYFKRKNIGATASQPETPTPPKEGFFESLGHSLGVGKQEFQQEIEAAKAHPIATMLKPALGPLPDVAQSAASGYMRSTEELGQALDSFGFNIRQPFTPKPHPTPSMAEIHAWQAIPIIGPGLERGANQLGPGENINLAEAGTALGTAIQAGPMVEGLVPESAMRSAMELPRRIRTAAMEDPLKAAYTAYAENPTSKYAKQFEGQYDTSVPYLSQAQNLTDLQRRIPQAMDEVYSPVARAIELIKDRVVRGPNGETTIGRLEAERRALSPKLDKLRNMREEDRARVLQQGETYEDLQRKYDAMKSVIGREVKRLGVDYDGVFRTYAQLADLRYRVGSAEQGMSTYAQPNTPYGFGRIGKAVKNISVWHPASWLRPVFETVPATRDIAAGRPLWAGKAQDIAVREAYRPMAPKPNLGTPIPPAYRTVLGLPASTIANAEYTMGGGPPTLEAYPGQYEYRQAQPLGMARPMQGTQYPQLPAETGRATGYATTRPPSGAGTTERIAPNRFAKPEVLPPSPKGFTVGPNGEIVRNPRALLPGAQESVPPPPPTETPVYPHGSAHRGEGAKAPTNYAPASQFRGPKEKPFTATELLQMHQTEAELVKASKGAKSEQEAAEYRKAIAMARKAAGVKK